MVSWCHGATEVARVGSTATGSPAPGRGHLPRRYFVPGAVPDRLSLGMVQELQSTCGLIRAATSHGLPPPANRRGKGAHDASGSRNETLADSLDVADSGLAVEGVLIMTKGHAMKTSIRERMAKTGESFTAARGQLLRAEETTGVGIPPRGDQELIQEMLAAFLKVEFPGRREFFLFLRETVMRKAETEGWLASVPPPEGPCTIERLRALNAWPPTWQVGSRFSVAARKKVMPEDLVLAQEMVDLFTAVLPEKREACAGFWKHQVDRNHWIEEWEGPPPPPRQRPSWGAGRERWVRRYEGWVARREAEAGKPFLAWLLLREIERATGMGVLRIKTMVSWPERDVSQPSDQFLWATARLFDCDPGEFYPGRKGQQGPRSSLGPCPELYG